MNASEHTANKGYLKENFRLFHLRDKRSLEVEPHYHEFDKAVIFLSGDVEYSVEGVSYRLRPGDILFIRHHNIHRLSVGEKAPYERCVLWISSAFLREKERFDVELEGCFELSEQRHAYLYHPDGEQWTRIRQLLAEIERADTSLEFGSELVRSACFLHLMVYFNRCVLSSRPQGSDEGDETIDEVMRYIANNLQCPLRVDDLASMCYMSRYYFMRRFKESTGYTVHGYIQLKRLSNASELLCQGVPVSQAAAASGFEEYSSFLRAFKKQYGASPREYTQRSWQSLEGEYEE